MDMNGILQFLITYKYIALFPVAFFEGPIVALVAGFLIHQGYLNPVLAYIIMILGDLIPDTIYYYAGRYGNNNRFVKNTGAKLGIKGDDTGVVEKMWKNHPFKTMFLSKLAYGLSTPFLISAGLVKMPLKKFVSLTLPITLFQYGVILIIGYLLGNSFDYASKYIKYAGFIIAGIIIILIILYISFTKYAAYQVKKLESEEEEKIKQNSN